MKAHVARPFLRLDHARMWYRSHFHFIGVRPAMTQTLQPSETLRNSTVHVTPSKVDPMTAAPFTLDQELEAFGTWVDEPIWVPPKDSSVSLAESMHGSAGLFASKEQRWDAVVDEHRSAFTQVREIDLAKASIRLPQGKFFVSVTEQENFDTITDEIPNCVQTRLEEFLAGPGRQKGVKVYYLKPLCVEVGDDLILTSRDDLFAAITQIQDEVFSEYRRLWLERLPRQMIYGATNVALAMPRRVVNYFVQRRQKAIDDYQKSLEFKRRKAAMRAAKTHRKYRTDGCTFNEMLKLAGQLDREDVVEQYAEENELSRSKRRQLLRIAAGSIPWFVTLSVGASYLASLSFSTVPPLIILDPAFVAEMPGSNGTLLKIGHFDEVGGVTHVEL